MEGVVEQLDGYAEVIVKKEPVLLGTRIGRIENGRLVEILAAHGQYLCVSSGVLQGYVKAKHVKAVRLIAYDDLTVEQSILTLGSSGKWTPGTVQDVQQGMLRISDEDGEVKYVPANQMNECIRIFHDVASSRTPSPTMGKTPGAAADRAGRSSTARQRSAIELVSVRWMRSQWDCGTHRPKAGSWLEAYVSGRPVPQTFPRCQELPLEATRYWEDVPEPRRVAVSHRWQTTDHPSPTGSQFSELLSPTREVRVFNYLRKEDMRITALDEEDYVYFDYLSMPQPPRDKGMRPDPIQWRKVQRRQAVQSTEYPEEAGFQKGLELLTNIFSRWRSFIIFISDEEFYSYCNRSWCLFEMKQILQSFGSSLGRSLVCANSFVYLYVSSVSLSLASPPSLMHHMNSSDRIEAVARHYFQEFSKFLEDILRTSASKESDKAVLVREQTKAVALNMHVALGTHCDSRTRRLARILQRGLQLMAATSACGVNVEVPPMSTWRKEPPSLEEVRSFGRSALSVACLMERWDLASVLLTEALKDPNFLNPVLAMSCKFCCLPAVQQLLSEASINAAGKRGTGPLALGTFGSHVRDMQQLLTPAAAGRAKYDEMPLDAQVVQRLLAAGPAISSSGALGWTPLLVAAEQGHAQLVNELVAAGAVVNTADQHDWSSPLIRAAQNGHAQVVQRLVVAAADVNQADIRGATPLILAAQKGHAQVVHQLLEARAAVNAASADGTALQVATQMGRSLVVEQLRDWGGR